MGATFEIQISRWYCLKVRVEIKDQYTPSLKTAASPRCAESRIAVMLDVKLELICTRPVKQLKPGALLVLKTDRSNILDIMMVRVGKLSGFVCANLEGTTISRTTDCEICSF